MTSLINHLLAHHLANNESATFNSKYVLGVLQTERAIAKCEAEEGSSGPVMHRWNLRVASLILPSLLPPIRTIGFQLLHSTFTSSNASLLTHSKANLAPALNILGSARPDPTLYLETLKVVQLILVRSTWHAEWARETVGAAVVQRTVQSFITAANGPIPEIKIPSIDAIVSLIPLFPTPLRPLSPALHTLAYDSICDTSGSVHILNAGSTLFVSLYLLAPKGTQGLRDAWRKGVEALIGSVDVLVPAVTSDIFAEDPLTNHTLSALALPSLQNSSPVTALCRLESLAQALCFSLRTPTSEKTGPVEVPIGALVELGVRLVGMSIDMPVKERTDPTTLTHTLSLLPRLQVAGCQILAQAALCIGYQMSSHATEVLGVISRTLSTYKARSPMRPTLSTTYSIIHGAIGTAVDPDDGNKHLARVWRSVLEDIGSIAIEPPAASTSVDKTRKNKRQKTYDPSENLDLGARRVRLDDIDLAIATRGLATLERLLASPHSFFLPPKLQLATCRLLIAISLDPAFFASHPTTSTSPSFFPATSASKGLHIATQSDTFRRGVILCLRAALEGSAKETGGLPEKAAQIWKRGCTDSDDVIKSISVTALNQFSTLMHPILPPLQVNTTFERLKQERLGGVVGDEASILTTAEEFSRREEEILEAEEMTVDEIGNTVEEELASVSLRTPTAPAFSASSFGVATSSTTSNSAPTFGAAGFPSFTSKLSDDVPTPSTTTAIVLDTEISTVTLPPFSSLSTSTNSSTAAGSAKGKNARKVEEVDSDDDDDFVMPKIIDDSSDEE